jgi:hypothetical protein
MCGPGDIGVRQDGKKLRRGSAKDPRRVHIAHSAGQRRSHHLQRLVRRTCAIGLDQQNSKVPLITVRPRQLILQDRPHESIIEKTGRAIDDMQRLGLGIVGPHPARRAKDRTVGQG